MALLDDLAIMLDLPEDYVSDYRLVDRLNLIIDSCEKRILSRLPQSVTAVPDELAWITLELAVKRYNRIGNEGMDAYSQEGESLTFGKDDLAPYLDDINAWCAGKTPPSRGRVRFI